MHKNKYKKGLSLGFTVVELLIVIFVIGLLAALVLTQISNWQERTYKNKADIELVEISNAVKLYVNKYNKFPPDVNRAIPAEIGEFLSIRDTSSTSWHKAPWPDSVYDYDDNLQIDSTGNIIYDIDGNPVIEGYQIAIRFCPTGGPLSACRFPKSEWAQDFDIDSSYYYCVKGKCRSHESHQPDYPGYCVNCPNHTPNIEPMD